MFRDIVRKKNEITRGECIEILKHELRGVLAVNGDGGYPYCMPMNHYYCEEDGMIYFHGGKTGHKIDSLKADDRVCFCVHDEGVHEDGNWALTVRSVVVFGRVHFIDDYEYAMDIARKLSRKFTDDTGLTEEEIRRSGKSTLCFAIEPEHISGKRVKEQ